MSEANTTATDSTREMSTLKAVGIVAGVLVGLPLAVAAIALACTTTISVEDGSEVASENPESASDETQGDA